jgi:FAD/FMN-containing dehydrogenase
MPRLDDQLTFLRVKLLAAGCELPIAGNAGWEPATRKWNGALDSNPALVARCTTGIQVSEAIRAVRHTGLRTSIHNGGQDWNGRSLRNDNLIIDLSGMTAISVDAERHEATIGGGVTTEQLNQAVGEHGLAAVIGNDGAVGVVGLTLGGGYSPLMTRFGLACDNLLSAEVVLPDGEIVRCDASQRQDLFWALRGGGGNFGVVTSARIRLHALQTVLGGSVVFRWPDAPAALQRFGELMLSAPAELFGAAVLSIGPTGQPVAVISPVWTGDAAQGEAIVAEIVAAGTPLLAKVSPMPANELLSLTDQKLPQGRGYEVATRWLATLSPAAVDAILSAFEARTSPLSSIIIHHCHGAATEVAAEATAFGMREPHFSALIYAAWTPATGDAGSHRQWARKLAADLASNALPGGYANLLSDGAADQIRGAFGPNGSRLAQLKEQIDPDALLRAIPLP